MSTTTTTTPTTTPPTTINPTINPITTPTTTIPRTIIITTIPSTITTTSTTGPIPTAPIPQMSGTPQQIVLQPKPEKLSKFNGVTKEIRVQTWLKLFEVHTIAFSDLQRVQNLLYYLSDVALEWYGDEIADNIGNPQYNWDLVKQRMVRRFDCSSAQPLIEAKDLKLKQNQTLEDYYRAKIRLLNQTSLSEPEKIQMLTEGLPFTWKASLAPIPIITTDVWFECAQKVEAIQSKSFARRDTNHKPQYKSQNKPHRSFNLNTQRQQRPESQAPYPCRYCQNQGRVEYHWHSECPIKAKYRRNRDSRQTTPKQLAPSNRNTNQSNPTTAVAQPTRDSSSDSSQSNQTQGPSAQPNQRRGHSGFHCSADKALTTENGIVLRFLDVDVKLEGVPIKSFVDSGSTISVASLKTIKRLNVSLIPNSAISLDQVSGLAKTIGSFKAKLQIANKTKSVTFHVIKDFKYPLLLGLDIGKRFGLHLDLGQSKISMLSSPNDTEYTTLTLEHSQSQQLKALLSSHKQVFSQNETDIGRIKAVTHKIVTIPHPPIQLRSYRRPQTEYDKIREIVKDLLAKKLIRESKSPWKFPTVMVKKKDNSDRMCIDYRKLNEITIDDKMPLPRIHEILDRLRGAKFFTTLDIAWGYWQVEMDPDSIENTAFVTNEGHYEWLVMPFGLKNAPATFQRIIQKILGNLIYRGAINYLDDIIIYTNTFEEHLQLLDKVFTLLAEYGIKLRPKKCHFAQESVQYLGHVVSLNEVRPSPEKIEAIKSFPVPTSKKNVKSFLGLAGYFCRFSKDYQLIAKPLNKLSGKNSVFRWEPEHQKAFETIKSLLQNDPVLAIFDPQKPCTIYTDASIEGIGAIITQKDDNDNEHVVEYFSRCLNPHQRNYTVSELECLAVVEAVKHFECYLNLPFTVVTDHSALQWLLNFKEPKTRLFRWSVRLSTQNYKIVHRPGVKQQHVDALSRNPLPITVSTFLLSPEEIIAAQSESNMDFVESPVIRNGVITIKSNGLHKAVVPPSLRERILKEFHDDYSHPGINKSVSLITRHYWWPQMIREIKAYVRSCRACQSAKYSHRPTFGKYICPEPYLRPFEIIGLDTIVMGSAADKSYHKYIQVLIDHHTRYVWAFPTKHNNSETIKNILVNLMNNGVTFEKLLTDNYPSFHSREMKQFYRQHEIKHIISTPYHPQTNGMVERVNGTIITKLHTELIDNPRKKWSTLVPLIVRNYNRTPHDATGFPPEYLLYGIDNTPSFGTPYPPLEIARQLANERTDTHQQHRKVAHDKRHPELQLPIGAEVMRIVASNDPKQKKTSARYSGPYFVTRILGRNTYEIAESRDGPFHQANIDQLKVFVPREQTLQVGGNLMDWTSLGGLPEIPGQSWPFLAHSQR